MTAHVPVGLWVKVAGVDAVCGGVDARQLLLVEADEALSLLVDEMLGLRLAEGQHITGGAWSTDGGGWTQRPAGTQAGNPSTLTVFGHVL